MAWFAIGFLAWLVDRHLCDYLTLFPYLHCFWHVFVCLGKIKCIFEINRKSKLAFRRLFVNSVWCLFLRWIWPSRNWTKNCLLAIRRWKTRTCWNTICRTQRNKKDSMIAKLPSKKNYLPVIAGRPGIVTNTRNPKTQSIKEKCFWVPFKYLCTFTWKTI